MSAMKELDRQSRALCEICDARDMKQCWECTQQLRIKNMKVHVNGWTKKIEKVEVRHGSN
jgi:hypothetical protein